MGINPLSAVTQVTAVWFEELRPVLLGFVCPLTAALKLILILDGDHSCVQPVSLTNPNEEQRADQRGYGHQQCQPDTLPHLRSISVSTSSIRDGGPPQARRGSGVLMGSK